MKEYNNSVRASLFKSLVNSIAYAHWTILQTTMGKRAHDDTSKWIPSNYSPILSATLAILILFRDYAAMLLVHEKSNRCKCETAIHIRVDEHRMPRGGSLSNETYRSM